MTSSAQNGKPPRVQIALSRAEWIPAAIRQGADEILLRLPPPVQEDGADTPNPVNAEVEAAAGLLAHSHVRGAKIVLDLSAPHTDSGLAVSAERLRTLYKRGLDAVLVSDLGVLRMVRMEAPDAAVHWAWVSGPDGLAMAAALGCARAVLSPVLSREAVAALCARKKTLEIQLSIREPGCAASPLPPCGLSPLSAAVSGTRAAECPRTCRTDFVYGPGGEAALAVPDIDRLEQVEDFRELGVDVYGVSLSLWDEAEAAALIRSVRQSVPDSGDSGPDAADAASGPEGRRVPVRFIFQLSSRKPAQMGVDDFEGHTLYVRGPEPRRVRRSDADAARREAEFTTRLYQCAGTPFRCVDAQSRVGRDCAMEMDLFLRMKASLLRKLETARAKPPERAAGQFRAGVRYLPRREAPVITARVRDLEQLSRDLLEMEPACLYIPLTELAGPEGLEWAAQARDFGVPVAAVLPVHLDGNTAAALARCADAGVREGMARHPAQLGVLERLGFAVRADFSVTNSQTLKELKRFGAASATLSTELTLADVRDMSHVMDTELVVYGRRSLLLSETCLIRRDKGNLSGSQNMTGDLCGCEARAEFTGPDGARYPVIRETPGHASVLLDEAKLWLIGEAARWRRVGLWAARLDFTTENAKECAQTLERHLGLGRYEPNRVTTGSYL